MLRSLFAATTAALLIVSYIARGVQGSGGHEYRRRDFARQLFAARVVTDQWMDESSSSQRRQRIESISNATQLIPITVLK